MRTKRHHSHMGGVACGSSMSAKRQSLNSGEGEATIESVGHLTGIMSGTCLCSGLRQANKQSVFST